MYKIVCEVCGTVYSESEMVCPICGSKNEYGAKSSDVFDVQMPRYESNKEKSAKGDADKKTLFYDYGDTDDDSVDDVNLSQMHHTRHNYFAVIVLTIVITLLILCTGYLFFRYYLPNKLLQNDTEITTEEPTYTETIEETTTIPTIPCQSIVLTAGAPELSRIGQYWLLHVIVVPEDTTDTLTFVSANEDVVTVTDEGRLCAVGEGETSIVITCGKMEIVCPVKVSVPQQTEPETTDTAPTEETAADQTKTVPEETSVPEETVEEPSQPVTDGEQIVLKIKQKDISFTKKGISFQLELDCDLKPEDVEWITMNSNVVICNNGLITVMGSGTTKVIARYKGQEVSCIVRCNLK